MPFLGVFQRVRGSLNEKRVLMKALGELWKEGFAAGRMRVRVQTALKELLRADTPEEKHAALERHRDVLLSDTVDRILASIGEQKREVESSQESREFSAYINAHRELLRLAREVGIEAAWKMLEEASDIDVIEIDSNISQVIMAWITAPTQREKRRFLEEHKELLDDSVLTGMEEVINRLEQDVGAVEIMHQHLNILQEVRSQGGTITAIREVYVNTFGGLTLDIPPWLEQQEQQITSLQKMKATKHAMIECRSLLLKTIASVECDTGIVPEVLAELRNMLGDILTDDLYKDYRAAIDAYRQSLRVYTYDRYSERYAQVQYKLGSAYFAFSEGEQRDDQECALVCLEAALEVYNNKTFPIEWAATQYNLALVYLARIEGERHSNLKRTIICLENVLQVYTPDKFPHEWAMTQHILGNAYLYHLQKEQKGNAERAITCYEAALQVFSHVTSPLEWATTQQNLSIAYRRHIGGVRKDNLEKAIAYSKSALEVVTRESFPQGWAENELNLGTIYFERIEGVRKENLERAILCYKSALQVFNRGTFPQQWALASFSLGNVYCERMEGEREANIEQAIHYYRLALQIWRDDTTPPEWAMAQFGLGAAYFRRVQGERRANLEEAIRCCEAALQALSRDTSPYEWAIAQFNLGSVYTARVEGERRINLERAISCYEIALQVFTKDAFSQDWANTQNNLGTIYLERIEGTRRDNQEHGLACYRAALQVFTRHAFPLEWARVQSGIGNAYMNRLEGVRGNNLKQAINYYEAALEVLTYDAFPADWANIQYGLGNACRLRSRWGREEYLEQAIRYFEAALRVQTRDAFPLEWATTQYDLGNAFSERTKGERDKHLERAIACYEAALLVRTRSTLPDLYRLTLLKYADAEMERGNWGNAQAIYANAQAIEEVLLHMAMGAAGRNVILKGGRDAGVREGYALIQLGRVADAIVAVEHSRARGLAEMQLLRTSDAERISDVKLRTRYEAAQQHLLEYQSELNAPLPSFLTESERRRVTLGRVERCQEAMKQFDALLVEIRKSQDLTDFLNSQLDAAVILRAAQQKGEGHGLVYLAATPWGGFAITVVQAPAHRDIHSHFAVLDLPLLTDAFIRNLCETLSGDEAEYVIGGYSLAQEGSGFGWIRQQWTGKTFRDRATALHEVCIARKKISMLDKAAQHILHTPALTHLVDQSLDQMKLEDENLLANSLEHIFLQLELQCCMQELAEAVVQPLSEWLREQGFTHLTLIPCGILAALPLVNILLADGITFSELFSASVAPSARSLLRDEHTSLRHKGVYTLGNPFPTHQDLPWSEAEALTIVRLAHTLKLGGYVKVQKEATRDWLTQALQQGLIVDASCHGRFETSNFLHSALLLAKGQNLPLGSLLSHEVDLRGLRLLILSACQTSVLDLRGAVSEVQSLAVGMLQAGATAVLASLWSVDDKATYLLMVRFAQEWLPRMSSEAPVVALARAQHWLRTVTNHELLKWQSMNAILPAAEEKTLAKVNNPWTEDQQRRVFTQILPTTRSRGKRLDIQGAEFTVHIDAKRQDNLDARPYAHPIYWAGFQITGW